MKNLTFSKISMSLTALALLAVFGLMGCPGPIPPEATLQSIAVTPANLSIPASLTSQFTATGIYSDGTSQNITSSVTWSSGTTSVATVAASGLATSIGVGSSVITATSGSISGSTTLTVTSATLQSIAVTPTNPSIPAGLTSQFTATGTYSDGTSQDITSSVTWTSGTTSLAIVAASGLATAVGAGSSVIKATLGSVSGNTTLTVTGATLQSIAVTPANPSISVGLASQFTATGTYSDGTSQNITSSVTWTSGTTSVATVVASGLASGIGAGSSVITATLGSISGSTTLTVTAAMLQSIAVTPANPSIPAGLTIQFTATGAYSDGTSYNITSWVTWASGTTTVATVNNSGLVSAISEGAATITATSGNVAGSVSLTVTAASLVSITVTSNGPDSIAKGEIKQFFATGNYSDGTSHDITGQSAWSSSNPAQATVNNSGLATAQSAGTANILAALDGVTGSATLTVLCSRISGSVTNVYGEAASGALISLSGAGNQATVTDGNGDYEFPVLSNGAYTVTPTKSGCVFTPDYTYVALGGDLCYTADFLANCSPNTLTVTGTGTGIGTVTSNDGKINCNLPTSTPLATSCTATYGVGEQVTLTATPDSTPTNLSEFTGWSGAGCSGTGPCVVTFIADAPIVDITAAFAAAAPKITFLSDNDYFSLYRHIAIGAAPFFYFYDQPSFGEFIGFPPYSNSISQSVSESFGMFSASASQTSQGSATSIIAIGASAVDQQMANPCVESSPIPFSESLVVSSFSLNQRSAYRITAGSVTYRTSINIVNQWTAQAAASISLYSRDSATNPSTYVTFIYSAEDAAFDPPSNAVLQTGILEPGIYTFEASSICNIYYNNFCQSGFAESSFNFLFELVPGASP